MWIPDGKEYKNIELTPSAYDSENPFNGRGNEDILKEGGRIRFYYFGNYYSVYVPAVASKKVTYVYLFIGDWPTSSKYITINRIGKFTATKNMVEKQRDVPNRYATGSEVVINCQDDSIELNGLPVNDELITGSEFAALPVGGTDVEFYVSSWCTEQPTVTVEYNKRWC